MTEAGARRAARFGLPLYLDPLHTITELEPLVQVYRSACAASGHSGRIVLSRWGWVDADGATDVWWPHVRAALWQYLVEIPRFATISAAGAHALDLTAVAEDRLLVGDPAAVAATVRSFARRLGAEQVVVKLQGSTGPWGEPLAAAVALYGSAVIGADPSDADPSGADRTGAGRMGADGVGAR
jgi:hypothetical protein